MYRVELKEYIRLSFKLLKVAFLMYRVELKGVSFLVFCIVQFLVPNVPCGVESTHYAKLETSQETFHGS